MFNPAFTYTIKLPLTDNDGNSNELINSAILAEVLEIAGGYSIGHETGTWKNEDGAVFHDSNLTVTTTIDELVKRNELESRLSEWCAMAKQQALYVSKQRCDLQFAEPAKITVSLPVD